MIDLLEFIDEYEGMINNILDILPSDPHLALTVLSVCIDKYTVQIGEKGMECWDEVYKIAKEIHTELGDYKL